MKYNRMMDNKNKQTQTKPPIIIRSIFVFYIKQ